MPTHSDLVHLQRWMQAVVVHPGTVGQGLQSLPATRELAGQNVESVICPTPNLSSAERVGIYHGMYLLRMEEVLASDYVALKRFVGVKVFRELVRDYVDAHPSRSFTLNRLGDHLPDFVRDRARLPRRAFCHELALLELAVAQVFDGQETSPIETADIDTVPADAWPRAVLQPISAFRLLSLRYPVNGYLQAVRDGSEEGHSTRRQDSWVAVYRRNYSVYRLDLEPVAHDLLASLVAGMPLGEAMEIALQTRGRKRPSEQQIFTWFRNWATGGVFRAIDY